MIVSVHQPNFLPWPGFFNKIKNSNIFVLLDHVQFSSRSYINRVKIFIENKPRWISIPIIKGRDRINLSKISNHRNWKRKLLHSIHHNYSSLPMYGKYIGEIKYLINYEEKNLFDYNLQIINYFIKKLKINTTILKSSEILKNENLRGSEMIVHICKICKSNVYLAGDGAEGYEDLNIYKLNKIKYFKNNYHQKPYKQKHTKNFVKGLSILDCLFNVGFEKLTEYV